MIRIRARGATALPSLLVARRRIGRLVKPVLTKQGRHDLFWRAYADVRREGVAQFIGNSHARVFRFESGMISHVISASTAHNLVKPRNTTRSREKLFAALKLVKPQDYVVMVFGEVDCRYHIYYQYEKHGKVMSMESLIDNTIDNYGEVIWEASRLGHSVAVCSVVPASWRESKAYPYYGSPEVRSWITHEFNDRLRRFCVDDGFDYIDVYTPAADSNGFIKPEFSLDDIHLNSKIVPYVRQQLLGKFRWIGG